MRLGNEAKAKLFRYAGCKDPHAEVENEATAARGGTSRCAAPVGDDLLVRRTELLGFIGLLSSDQE